MTILGNSGFLYNTACPKCRESGRDRSGNNLGVYDDGHCYCWSCGYYVPSDAVVRLGKLAKEKHIVEDRALPFLPLPDDSDAYIPAVARQWLNTYNLSQYEITRHRLMWSEYWKQLIFPYFDKYGNLNGWQARNFSTEEDMGVGHSKMRDKNPDRPYKIPKWFSQGDLKKIYHVLPFQDEYDRIVLVEDIISAIKVSRHAPCMPLFGSQVGVERFVRLSKLTERLTLWLDYDKRTSALSETSRSLVPCDVIITELDPKELNDVQIQEKLENSGA